jgi:hypothetical protein
MCSPKYIKIIFNIIRTKGTVMIYSNYVAMEGLQLLKVYLNFFGYIDVENDENFNKKELLEKSNKIKNNDKDGYRFYEFHGGIKTDVRKMNKEIFNKPENIYGKYIKIIMISPAGAEGISLNNVQTSSYYGTILE